MYDFGLILFRDVVVRQPRVRPRLRRLLLDNVRRERSGEFIDKSLMKNTLGMLVELGVSQVSQDSAARTKSSTQHKSNSRSPMEAQGSGHAVYEEEFEQPFLEETQAFYHEEAQRFIAENTCPVYLRKVRAPARVCCGSARVTQVSLCRRRSALSRRETVCETT